MVKMAGSIGVHRKQSLLCHLERQVCSDRWFEHQERRPDLRPQHRQLEQGQHVCASGRLRLGLHGLAKRRNSAYWRKKLHSGTDITIETIFAVLDRSIHLRLVQASCNLAA